MVDILGGLNQAMEYIKAHLEEEVDLDAAARLALYTKEGFSRFFSYFTGITLAEYIRRRRLTRAAYMLRDSSLRVIDLAVLFGYGSADAFRRAFYKQHRITPSAARNPEAGLKIYPPLSFHISLKGADIMDFKIVNQAPLTLMGIHKAFTGPAANRFTQEHILWADHHDNAPERISQTIPGIWYGVWDHGVYWVLRDPADVTEKDLATYTLAGDSYAVFQTEPGGFAGEVFPRLQESVMQSWLADAGYRQTRDVEVEVYHLFPGSEKHRRYYELWIPVEKR